MLDMRWEYRTVQLDEQGWLARSVNFAALDDNLNQLGMDGWELVNVIYVKDRSLGYDSAIAFLKRPLK